MLYHPSLSLCVCLSLSIRLHPKQNFWYLWQNFYVRCTVLLHIHGNKCFLLLFLLAVEVRAVVVVVVVVPPWEVEVVLGVLNNAHRLNRNHQFGYLLRKNVQAFHSHFYPSSVVIRFLILPSMHLF